MIVTMLGVTWKIRSWKTGKVPFKMPLVYKSQVEGIVDASGKTSKIKGETEEDLTLDYVFQTKIGLR